MFRALSIVHAAAIIGHAHAAASAGCYPNYASGRTYAIGEWASTSVTTATPISYVTCSPPGVGRCPSSGLRAEGGFSTSDLYNFQCISDDLCSNYGYAPGSINSELAWTRDSTPCLPTSTAGDIDIDRPAVPGSRSVDATLTMGSFTRARRGLQGPTEKPTLGPTLSPSGQPTLGPTTNLPTSAIPTTAKPTESTTTSIPTHTPTAPPTPLPSPGLTSPAKTPQPTPVTTPRPTRNPKTPRPTTVKRKDKTPRPTVRKQKTSRPTKKEKCKCKCSAKKGKKKKCCPCPKQSKPRPKPNKPKNPKAAKKDPKKPGKKKDPKNPGKKKMLSDLFQ